MSWLVFAQKAEQIDEKIGYEIVEYCHEIGYPSESYYDRFLIDTNKDGDLCIVIVSQYSCYCSTDERRRVYIPAKNFENWRTFLDKEVARLKEEERIAEEKLKIAKKAEAEMAEM